MYHSVRSVVSPHWQADRGLLAALHSSGIFHLCLGFVHDDVMGMALLSSPSLEGDYLSWR